MRTIKFRCWDKELNRMYGGGFSVSAYGEISIQWTQDKNRFDFSEDIVLMQNTGLLDKNGKEIYEGDIVYAEPMGEGTGEFYVVSWALNGRWYLQHKDVSKDSGDLVVQKLEIIGNLYENPELLK